MSDETKPRTGDQAENAAAQEPVQAPEGGAAAGEKDAERSTLETFTTGQDPALAAPVAVEGSIDETPGAPLALPEFDPANPGPHVAPAAAAAVETATDPAQVETATAPAPAEKPAPPPVILPRPADGKKAAKGFTRVRNLTAWGGRDFSFGAGEILDLPDDMALGRAEAGLVEIL